MSDYLNKRARERELEKIRGRARNGNGNGRRRDGALRISPDEAEEADRVDNLTMYAVHTSELYPQRLAVQKALARYHKRGDYTRELGVGRFETFARKAARRYAQEFKTGPGARGYGPFSLDTIKGAAVELAESFEAEAALGNYPG